MPSETSGAADPASRAVEAFTMHLGSALHRFGTPAHSLEEAMTKVARRFGVDSHFISTPTSITAAFGAGQGQNVYLVRANQGEINLEKLSLLDQLSAQVISGKVKPADAYKRVDAIIAAPAPYSAAVTILSYAATSGAVARLFAGGWPEMAVAAFIGLVIGMMAILSLRFSPLARIFDMSAAVLSALVAAATMCWVGPFSTHTATLAGLIVLIPGFTLTTAVTELATGNLVSGTARLVGAGTTFLKLGFGAALGTQLGMLIFHVTALEMPTAPPAWTLLPATAIAGIALFMVLQGEPREMKWVFANCMVGLAGTHVGGWIVGAELGPFVAAFAVTMGSSLFARWTGRAASITQVPGILLLVPGSVGYRSIAAMLERNVLSGVEIAFSMALTAMALVAGILLANVLLPAEISEPPLAG